MVLWDIRQRGSSICQSFHGKNSEKKKRPKSAGHTMAIALQSSKMTSPERERGQIVYAYGDGRRAIERRVKISWKKKKVNRRLKGCWSEEKTKGKIWKKVS